MTKSFRALSLLCAAGAAPGLAQQQAMTFFVTSAGPGDGAALGGLEGADAHCTALAQAAGVTGGGVNWRAYLSRSATAQAPAINARDRIGTGPWFNHAGVRIARDVAELHSDAANLTKATILTEKGDTVNGRSDRPNMHDILTGSQQDGTAFGGPDDTTCHNWTGNGEGSARVGHHDRQGLGESASSWNSAHGSRGCSQANLQATGGNGLFYCFGVR